MHLQAVLVPYLHTAHTPAATQTQVLETEEGGYRWGKHCSYCRHDRHRKMTMLLLHFRGQRQPVAL